MSFKSWVTGIRNMEEWEEFEAAFIADMEKVDDNGNRLGHECRWTYALKIDEDLDLDFRKIEAGTVMVAWEADSGVYCPILPESLIEKTWYLTTLLEDCPEWITKPDGPFKFGTRAEARKGVREFSQFLSSKGIVALFEDAE